MRVGVIQTGFAHPVLYYLFDSTFFYAIFFKDSPFDSIGTYGATVADLNNDGYLDIIGCAYGYGVVMWGSETGTFKLTI